MKKVSISKIVEKPVSGEWGNEAESETDGTPVIRNTNFSDDGRIDLHDVAFREIPDRKIEKKRLKPGDIIIEKSGGSKNQPVGRVVYFDIDDDNNYLFSNFTSAIRPKKEVEPKYVHYGLLHSYMKGGSELFQNKTTGIRNLQLKRYLDKVKIPLPSLSEQKAIVAKLDRAQRLIDIDREMLTKYDDLIQSVFLEMFGDPVKNEKGLPKRKIKEIGEVVTGNTPPKKNPENYGSEIEWVKTTNIVEEELYPTTAEEYLSKDGKELGRIIPKNSLIVCCIAGSLSSIGKCSIVDREIAINQQINAIVPNSENVDTTFLYAQLFVGKRLIQDASTKSMKGMVSKSKFQKIELLVPEMRAQIEFSTLFVKIGEEKNRLRNELKRSEELFSSFVQGAFG